MEFILVKILVNQIMVEERMQIDSRAKETQRMIEIGADEVWTPFLESINSLMLEEKKQRQENDSFKGAEVCCKIVSHKEIEQ